MVVPWRQLLGVIEVNLNEVVTPNKMCSGKNDAFISVQRCPLSKYTHTQTNMTGAAIV